MFKRRTREPGPSEAAIWRDLANLTMELAHGRSHDWREASRLRRMVSGCDVFGQGGEENVCARLLSVLETAALSANIHDHTDDMARYAGEVLRRYKAWYALRAAARSA